MEVSTISKQSNSTWMGMRTVVSKRICRRLKFMIKNFLLLIIWLLLLLGMSVGSVFGLAIHPNSTLRELAAAFNKTLTSVAADDGWILESTETSVKGGSMNATFAAIYLGDDALNRQYRSVLSFDTRNKIPANAVIKTVVLKIKKQSVSGTNPFSTHGNLTVDIRKGLFSSNRALQLGDFSAASNKNNVMNFSKVPVKGWYTATLGSGDYGYINRTGVTQFRLRFTRDDNDDRGADILKVYSGSAVATNKPQLIITYQVDTTAPAAINNLSAVRGTSAGRV
ncbi:MAG: hypothetical protein EHM81_04465, partial [Chloroflexi bacterium]